MERSARHKTPQTVSDHSSKSRHALEQECEKYRVARDAKNRNILQCRLALAEMGITRFTAELEVEGQQWYKMTKAQLQREMARHGLILQYPALKCNLQAALAQKRYQDLAADSILVLPVSGEQPSQASLLMDAPIPGSEQTPIGPLSPRPQAPSTTSLDSGQRLEAKESMGRLYDAQGFYVDTAPTADSARYSLQDLVRLMHRTMPSKSPSSTGVDNSDRTVVKTNADHAARAETSTVSSTRSMEAANTEVSPSTRRTSPEASIVSQQNISSEDRSTDQATGELSRDWRAEHLLEVKTWTDILERIATVLETSNSMRLHPSKRSQEAMRELRASLIGSIDFTGGALDTHSEALIVEWVKKLEVLEKDIAEARSSKRHLFPTTLREVRQLVVYMKEASVQDEL